jgi:hypothetical protein
VQTSGDTVKISETDSKNDKALRKALNNCEETSLKVSKNVCSKVLLTFQPKHLETLK